MNKKALYDRVLAYFESAMPEPQTELRGESAFELLVAVVLSAQCTDRRVNLTTPALFAAYPTPQAMALATPDDVYALIKSISYPHNKARHLVGLSRRLVEEYGGEVPEGREELMTLPGVGRKTANVVESVLRGKATMAVDTHVFRVAHRLALVPQRATTPLAVERCLVENIPTPLIPRAHHWLLLHGRYVCTARRPKCETCALKTLCAFGSEQTNGETR